MIARVIVDVATNNTDRLFDYIVPDTLMHIVLPGMRVVVPFGPRKVQGFVIEVNKNSSVDESKLKPIADLIDIEPPLTSELLQLAQWLKEKTLSFHINVLQVMLPAAMKAKYNKLVMLHQDADMNDLTPYIKKVFSSKEQTYNWNDLIKKSGPREHKELLNGVKSRLLYIKPVVSSKETKKLRTVVKPNMTITELHSICESLPNNAKKQKELVQYFINHFETVTVVDLIEKVPTSRSTISTLVEKEILIKEEVEMRRDPFKGREYKRTSALPLTEQQTVALSPIINTLENNKHETFLLRGVTGSGKTEVYLQAIDKALKLGKEAIMLVPEISLTPQMVTHFKQRFGSEVAVLHSALSKGEKYDEWRRIRDKKVKVAVGARSAIFAPFENLGIIIIDEEHETSYKQEEAPRYHARDVAIKRGEHYSCPVILGSATPSLESYARAKKSVYHLLTMTTRVNNVQMPSVNIIDMREELRSGNRSMFSEPLIEAMINRIEKQEQIVLFLNRRGYSTFILCRDCGYVAECPHCDISLTYHRTNQTLQCHYCGHVETPPNVCPSCEGDSIRFFGSGTQKVEEELNKVLSGVRVIRMDVDTTRRKGSHEELLNKFGRGEADVLLGTQMIAKGLDFPNITLVGVLAADSMLHIPDFRSAERTFQLLTQVSGRAGRHQKKGEVLIQSYTPDHYSIQDVKQHDFVSFFEKEMKIRKQAGHPPYYYLILIHVSDTDLGNTVSVAEKISKFIKSSVSPDTYVYGPVTSAIPRIKDRYRYQCMIKYKVEPNITVVLQEVLKTYQSEMNKSDLSIMIDTNPYMMM
ncbi:primosomal protein N' [Evansella cellulosilytica]|uniref:Replication restart protein PriA n=1 Tax=Evansella cellulosilytica (strain ATCC 21833 / DSM 2522 / FERM P-1141 / JCM 9156 / N-4) TaxID=649639 RepID=E6TTP2_EVAC2|nr:primosomal protein N' [Evansella cellulosilytica]ADU30811.1 primosomal protein N' [Evansella cellulosilytica DSM 2522]